MKGVVQFIGLILITGIVQAQALSKKLSEAVRLLEADEQMKYGILALSVVDEKTGVTVYDRNAKTGLPVASTQKVITAITTFELLGGAYTYKTELAHDGKIENGILKGSLYVLGSGDPTFGSWRYDNTAENSILQHFTASVTASGIRSVSNGLKIYDGRWESQTVPGGWIWDDIGNYYGAGVSGLNWRENQYDIRLKSGAVDSKVTVVSTEPAVNNLQLISEVEAGKAGSGDNAFIYTAPYSGKAFIRGTIPPNQAAFIIKGSLPDPGTEFGNTFLSTLKKEDVDVNSAASFNSSNNTWKLPATYTLIATHISPQIKNMMPYFLQKSINLYGEAFLKTLGFEKKGEGSYAAGIAVIKSFWKNNGIDPNAIYITDGSGLSMQSRVTAESLTKVMQFARSRPWFNSFNASLPEFNGIKMKSGTITGIKSFTGYLNGYTFAIIINNYSGSSSEITRKIYKVLDVLK
jgi:D-alanyl-D-alanine carboxypeptidase/D-alanyl-D-alanine-endopeptidase (penicillin-binding protein 4)